MNRRKFIKIGAAAITLAFANGLEKILPAPDASETVLNDFEKIEALIYDVKYPGFDELNREMAKQLAIHFQVPERLLFGRGLR